MTTEEIQKAIAEIGEILKGPNVPNFERQCLHEERKDLRAILAARNEAEGKATPC